MAGILNLASGAAPATPSSGVSLYTPSGINDANGLSQNRRILATGTAAEGLQITDNHLPNLIRNGGFWFAQRQAAGTATTYSATAGRALSADGWGITNENASATYQRIDTAGGIQAGYQNQYYGEFLKITSNGKLVVSQVIEGIDSIPFRNRALRFTAWLKSANSIAVNMSVLYLNGSGTIDTIPATFVSAFGAGGTDPTFGTNISKCTGSNVSDGGSSMTGNVLKLTTATTWARFSAVWIVPNDCKNLIPAFWSDAQVTATQGFDVGQCSLTDGYEIQDWTPQSIAIEKERVCRYYQKSFTEATAPAQNAGANTGESKGIAGKATAVANAGFIFHRYQPPMRTGPGVTLYNPQAANALMRDQTAGADMGATATTGNTQNDVMINATGVAGTAVGNQIAIHWSADAEL
jgi:hypothetical protein